MRDLEMLKTCPDIQSRIFPKGCVVDLHLVRDERKDEAALILFPMELTQQLQEEGECSFGTEERVYWERSLLPRRRCSFLIGRVAARRVLGHLSAAPDSRRGIGFGVFGQSITHGAGGYQVSIAHSERFVTVVAFPAGHPLALDIEWIQPNQEDTVMTVLTVSERELVRGKGLGERSRERLLKFILWSAREALSKVLGCGFMCTVRHLAVKTLSSEMDGSWRGEFEHFAQWSFEALVIHGHVLALVHPKRTRIDWVER